MSVADVALSPIMKESGHCPGCFNNSQPWTIPSEDSSIVIYLSVAGSLLPMRVLESDSIASVKLRIQTFKGFVAKKQKLVFGGRELARNNSLVKEYGVSNGNVLHLVLKLSDLLFITIRTSCGQEFEFHVDRYKNVAYLKQRIFKEGRGFVDVEEKEIFYNGEELDDHRLVGDICDNNDAAIHLLVQKSAKVRGKPLDKNFEISVVAVNSGERRECLEQGEENQSEEVGVLIEEQTRRNIWSEPVFLDHNVKLNKVVQDMVKSTFEGLEKGNQPIRSSEGTGGTYFMQDPLGEGFVAVFKPMDEEPNAVNNPRGLPVSSSGEGLKKGTRVGEGAVREVAAYILDHPISGPRESTGEVVGFAGVPPTVIFQCAHEGFSYLKGYQSSLENVKIGSLQMFVKNEGSCDDMGPGAFPVEEVHKISVFDIRMANADRHAGNILVSKREDGRTLLIPIDHGYCLPETFEDCTFDWLYWPQARQPYSPEVVEYIKLLDAERDIALLRFYGWDIPLECARILRISTMLLKKGVEKGLTPFAIGSIMCRENVNKESVIEKIVCEAQDSLLPGMSEVVFIETVSKILDTKLNKLSN